MYQVIDTLVDWRLYVMVTRKHFVHAARFIAAYSKRRTQKREAMLQLARNLFATYNPRFDASKFGAFIEKLDHEKVYTELPQ